MSDRGTGQKAASASASSSELSNEVLFRQFAEAVLDDPEDENLIDELESFLRSLSSLEAQSLVNGNYFDYNGVSNTLEHLADRFDLADLSTMLLLATASFEQFVTPLDRSTAGMLVTPRSVEPMEDESMSLIEYELSDLGNYYNIFHNIHNQSLREIFDYQGRLEIVNLPADFPLEHVNINGEDRLGLKFQYEQKEYIYSEDVFYERGEGDEYILCEEPPIGISSHALRIFRESLGKVVEGLVELYLNQEIDIEMLDMAAQIIVGEFYQGLDGDELDNAMSFNLGVRELICTMYYETGQSVRKQRMSELLDFMISQRNESTESCLIALFDIQSELAPFSPTLFNLLVEGRFYDQALRVINSEYCGIFGFPDDIEAYSIGRIFEIEDPLVFERIISSRNFIGHITSLDLTNNMEEYDRLSRCLARTNGKVNEWYRRHLISDEKYTMIQSKNFIISTLSRRDEGIYTFMGLQQFEILLLSSSPNIIQDPYFVYNIISKFDPSILKDKSFLQEAHVILQHLNFYKVKLNGLQGCEKVTKEIGNIISHWSGIHRNAQFQGTQTAGGGKGARRPARTRSRLGQTVVTASPSKALEQDKAKAPLEEDAAAAESETASYVADTSQRAEVLPSGTATYTVKSVPDDISSESGSYYKREKEQEDERVAPYRQIVPVSEARELGSDPGAILFPRRPGETNSPLLAITRPGSGGPTFN